MPESLPRRSEWVRGTFRLVQLDEHRGQVTDERTGRTFPPVPLLSALARGYWEEVNRA